MIVHFAHEGQLVPLERCLHATRKEIKKYAHCKVENIAEYVKFNPYAKVAGKKRFLRHLTFSADVSG